MKKFFTIIGFIVFAVISISLIIAIFVKQEYAIEREILINKANQEVFDYLAVLRNQENFSVWSKIDPSMKQEFSGIDGTVGFISAWDSENKNAGKGEQEIIKIIPGERIDYEIRFIRPFNTTDYAYLSTQAVNENQTRVIWGFNGKMKYPMNFFLLLIDMETMLGGDLETGLLNLKEILEK